LLNHGGAEFRLGEHAARLGLISPARAEKIASKKQAVESWIDKFEANGTALKMRRAGGLEGVSVPSAFMSLSKNAIDEVVYKLVYKGYLERDLRQIEKSSAYENVKIPESLDYSKVLGLRLEAGQKLASVRPSTVAQASRISGVSPADISVLLVHVKASGRGE
jgi:tRNA uridine 5-carboxymethylaminomethyl modification enzyme